MDEESVGQGEGTSRTDQESLTRRGNIDAYKKRMQWRAWALMGMEISWGILNVNETSRGMNNEKRWKRIQEETITLQGS